VRRQRSRLSSLEDAGSGAPLDRAVIEGGIEDGVEQRQSLSKVQAIVGQLPPKQQQALILKFSAGMSYKEIGEVMGLTASHVGVMLHYAIKTLRLRLGEHAADELRVEP
jgi:RNA polymerase sigma factor (sigma-70 family)